jgi:hypothetical protein
MSESEPTEQPSVEKTEVTDGANSVEVTESGDSATESDARAQEPADAEPAAETESESEPESEAEVEPESETEPAAEPETETETGSPTDVETEAGTEAAPEVEARDEVGGEQATQVVPAAQDVKTAQDERVTQAAPVEQVTQAVPVAQAAPSVQDAQPTQIVPTAPSPPQDLGFAPLGDPVPTTGAPATGAPAAGPATAGAFAAQPPAFQHPGAQAAPYPAQAYAQAPTPAPGFAAPGFAAPGFAPPGYAAPGQFQPPAQPSYGAYPAYAYGPMAVSTPAEPPVDPAVKKRKRKRILWTVAAIVVVGGLIGGGVYALLPGRTGNSIVAAVKCQPTHLASCLIKAPVGAVPLTTESSTGDKWPQQTAVTANEFAAHIITDSPGVGADAATELATDNVQNLVHNDWNAVDGSNIDLAVLSFDTQRDAQAWNSARTGEILGGYLGQTVGIPGDSTGAAHVAVKADEQGNIHAAYSVVVGDLVLNVAYSSPSPFNAQDLANWTATELASLRTAPAAPADPAPTPVGNQQVACQGQLTSCLTPLPDGGEPWATHNDPRWVGASTLSSAQMVHLFWDDSSTSVQNEVMANFTGDGVTGIGHEDWLVGDGDEQADLYLIQTITATGADSLTQDNFGDPDWQGGLSGVSYRVPGLSNVQAWYSNKTDANGFIEYSFTATIGNVIISGWFYFYGDFESSFANSWTKDQVESVTATEKTEPLGLFPLTAPALAAPSQGTCAASGDCLLPLPAGASDTTATSYEGTESLPAAQYAITYETSSSGEMTSWLASDGFQSGEHRSWTASNGATADAVLLKYAKPAQAKAAVLLEYGINAAGDRDCADPAVPDSYCLAEPVSANDPLLKQTVWVLAWKGDYEVSVLVTLSNSADLSQAYTWAQQQLDMLPAS